MSGSPKELLLWDACTSGDLDLVRDLVNDEGVNANWADPEMQRTAFYRACGHGRVAVVEFLFKDSRIDVNKTQMEGATPFQIACQQGHPNVVSLLLEDKRIEVNKPQNQGCTPFFIACENGHREVILLLLADMRIDVNKPRDTGST